MYHCGGDVDNKREDTCAGAEVYGKYPDFQFCLCPYPDAGRDWSQEEKGMTEGEMAGWHHRLNGHEFE